MLKGKFDGFYKKQGETQLRSRYVISGSDEEIAAYEKAQGTFNRQVTEGPDKGAPLHFRKEFAGDSIELGISVAGNVFLVEDSITAKAKSLINQNANSPALQAALANKTAEIMLAGLRRTTVIATGVKEDEKAKENAGADNDGEGMENE